MEEEFDQIGEKLRKARESAGLTIDDVVHGAHLPRSVVEALEAEDFSVFTSPIYAKSFLSQYSALVGVDADPWLDALMPIPFVSGETITSLIDSRFIPVETAPSRESRSVLPALLLLLVSAGLILAGIKVYGIMEERLDEKEEVAEQVAEPQPQPQPQQVGPVPGEVAERAPARENIAVPPEPETPEDETAQVPPRAIIVRD